MDVTVELCLIQVAESQIGLDTVLLLILNGSEVEGEDILLKKFLIDHFIEYWGNSSLGECWVS
jgi:hypothetical protein